MKRILAEERDKWLRKGKVVDKTNFLEIYGNTHLRALTPDVIKAAFRKTGVWPFNPSVITEDMMAPSKETSVEGHLPIIPPTPIRVIADLLQKLSVQDDVVEEDEDSDLDEPVTPTAPRTNVRKGIFDDAIKKLSHTQLAYITSGVPATSSNPVPPNPTQLPPSQSLLDIEPKTTIEALLQAELREARKKILQLQAANILNESYCNKLRFELAYKEEKENAPKQRGKLVGDGLPRLLSGDDFFERVVEFTKWQREEAAKKAEKQRERESIKGAVEDWKKREEERKKENQARKDRYHKALETWQKAKTKWVSGGKKGKFGVPRPKQEALSNQKSNPKPKVGVDTEELAEIELSEDEEDAEDTEVEDD